MPSSGNAGGFGTLAGVMALFCHEQAALAGWGHFPAFDLFIGAWACRTARSEGAGFRLVAPCLPVILLFGPAGLRACGPARVPGNPRRSDANKPGISDIQRPTFADIAALVRGDTEQTFAADAPFAARGRGLTPGLFRPPVPPPASMPYTIAGQADMGGCLSVGAGTTRLPAATDNPAKVDQT